RSLLGHKIQQLSKGSSEGSGITPEVPDDPKDNSAVVAEKQAGYVLTNLTLSSAELEIQSMMDVSIHQEDLDVQRTPLIDLVISMVTEKTASTPTPTTTQAHAQIRVIIYGSLIPCFVYFEMLRFENGLAQLRKPCLEILRKLPDLQAERYVACRSEGHTSPRRQYFTNKDDYEIYCGLMISKKGSKIYKSKGT
ncbi:hypothetical protein Tco_0818505, partial [Tanacetum coccineum]